MDNTNWDELEDFDDNDLSQKTAKKAKSKERKRKFREIEMIKEKHSLRRELSELDDLYSDSESRLNSVFN